MKGPDGEDGGPGAMTDPPRGDALLRGYLAVQAKLTPIHKNKTVTIRVQKKDGSWTEYTYAYADLEAIDTVLRPLISAEGIGVWQASRWNADAGGWVLRTVLFHPESDRLIEGEDPILWGKDNDPKGYGGGKSYARRYGVVSLFNLVAEDDDDGGRAQHNPEAATRARDEGRGGANAGGDGSERQPQGRRRQAPSGGATADAKPGAGLEAALRSAKGAGFNTGAFMAAQAKEHGLLTQEGKVRADLFDAVTAEQVAAILDALGKARSAAKEDDPLPIQ